MNPIDHFKNWLKIPIQPANQFKSIIPLCGSQSTIDDNESRELLRVSYQYQNDVNDTRQVKDVVKFRFWNLSKGIIDYLVWLWLKVIS